MPGGNINYVFASFDLDAFGVADAKFDELAASKVVAASILTGIGLDNAVVDSAQLTITGNPQAVISRDTSGQEVAEFSGHHQYRGRALDVEGDRDVRSHGRCHPRRQQRDSHPERRSALNFSLRVPAGTCKLHVRIYEVKGAPSYLPPFDEHVLSCLVTYKSIPRGSLCVPVG